jgi:hypothetical protein
MIFHVIDTAKYPLTSIPLASDARIVLSLMAIPVLFAGKLSLFGLRATFVPAHQVLAVSIEMLPQVTASPEASLRGAPRVSATPEPVTDGSTILHYWDGGGDGA